MEISLNNNFSIIENSYLENINGGIGWDDIGFYVVTASGAIVGAAAGSFICPGGGTVAGMKAGSAIGGIIGGVIFGGGYVLLS